VRLALLSILSLGCLARAEAPSAPATQECTSFPVRTTTAMGPFQAPADLAGARVNATKLPSGWTPVGGTVGEGGAYVIACRAAP
jgi:hypothetical protein